VDTINILGLVAGTCTTVAFIPQVLQVWRTRSAQDISIGMYSVFIVGVALWLVYGLVVNSMPVVVSNLVTLLLASAVLGMKMWFENRQKNA